MTIDAFPGDTNEILKGVQRHSYFQMAQWMFTRAQDRYQRALRLVGVETTLSRRLAQQPEVEANLAHGVLRRAYEAIAVHYRYAHDGRGQMPLPFENLSFEEHLAREWTYFCCDEVRQLVEEDAVALAILSSVAYGPSGQGAAAAEHLATLLKDRYDGAEPYRRAVAPLPERTDALSLTMERG